MTILFKCLRCRHKQEVIGDMKDFKKCPKCKETKFYQIYEHHYVNSQENTNSKLNNDSPLLTMTPTGSSPDKYNENEIKGGKTGMVTKTEERVAHANAVIDLLTSRGVDKDKMQAVLSRAYNMLKEKK